MPDRDGNGGAWSSSEVGPPYLELLQVPTRGVPRAAFLRAVSQVVLRHTGADHLELWVSGAGLGYRWCVEGGTPLRCSLHSLPLLEQDKEGKPPSPMRQALAAAGLEEGAPNLLPTPSGGWLESAAPEREAASPRGFFPFAIDGSSHGVLVLVSSSGGFCELEGVARCEALVEVLGVTMTNRMTQSALTERVKELTCMYRMAQLAAQAGRPLEDTIAEVVGLLPPAWQFPEITSARITIDQHVFVSRGFCEGPYRMAADVVVRGERCGMVEVYYTQRFVNGDDSDVLDEAPFLAEERHLIDGVAFELASIIERKQADEERDRLEQQIRRADRLATIGQLAAGVAHELNEPLGNILGFAQLAQKEAALPLQVHTDIERIVTASLYAREVIKKLMFFARQTPSRKTDLQLDQVVDDAVALLQPRCTKDEVVIVRRRAADLPPVLGDSAQLQQVVINLMVNAIQAMPSGGTLTLSTDRYGAAVRLQVEDTGVGMPASVVDRAFMPFFTTKEVGQGTGLGLSVVHGIVTSHGGSVAVESIEGRGTRFEVCFPPERSRGS